MQEKCIFFNHLQSVISNYIKEDVCLLVGGDFNCILSEQDNLGGNPHQSVEIKAFQDLIKSVSLYDTWREI